MASRRSIRERIGDDTWEEVISALQIALVFFALLAGRELGNIYNTFGEVSRLYIVFDVREEELAGFVREVLAGGDPDLEVGMAFTLPEARSIEGPVTELPDYARKWFISVTLSAIVIQQPEVSQVDVQLWVENDHIQTEIFYFERAGVPYRQLLKRNLSLHIEDVDRFRRVVQEASELYAGEVELKFTGQVLVHVRFLETWLPFFTARYPLVKAPQLSYVSSDWKDVEGNLLREVQTEEDAYVSIRLENPARVHSIWQNTTVHVYRDGDDKPVLSETKELGVAATSEATYYFRFPMMEPGLYRYSIETEDGFNLENSRSQELLVEATGSSPQSSLMASTILSLLGGHPTT
jgi:hypothetical protein